jgi:hypothetical protein
MTVTSRQAIRAATARPQASDDNVLVHNRIVNTECDQRNKLGDNTIEL